MVKLRRKKKVRHSKVRKKEHKSYRERAPYSTDMKIVVCVFVLLLIILWVLLFITGIPVIGLIILTVTTIIILIVMWFFLSMKFIITDLGIFATFGPTKYKIRLKDIDHIKPIKKSKLHWYTGWGIRLWRIEGKWAMAFVSQIKDSVFIKKRQGVFRNIILTTKNPIDFIKRVKMRM